ncbi:putative transposable element [Trichonephila clavipes]|nr:putative transposable element [Trichonephila clavipes]
MVPLQNSIISHESARIIITPTREDDSVNTTMDDLDATRQALRWDDTGDEVHFWLNGCVNKQNCRIWSEANPQEYVETPLHPEKLTVWCALWAGGILLQKR